MTTLPVGSELRDNERIRRPSVPSIPSEPLATVYERGTDRFVNVVGEFSNEKDAEASSKKMHCPPRDVE